MTSTDATWKLQLDAMQQLRARASAGDVAGVRSLSIFAYSDPRSAVAVDASMPGAETSIHHAALIGNVVSVARLLEQDSTVLFLANHHGRQAIHLAAHGSHPLLVLFLCNAGVDLSVRDAHRYSPLELALTSVDSAGVASLLLHGATFTEDDAAHIISVLTRPALSAGKVLPLSATLAAVGLELDTRPYLKEHLLVKLRSVIPDAEWSDLRRFSALQTVKIP